MPAGDELTLPLPLLLTESVYELSVNVADTEVAAVIDTVQVLVPVQPPPLHPLKLDPVEGEAVSVTDVPWLYVAVQVPPQLIPTGDDVTVPLPLPLGDTVSG